MHGALDGVDLGGGQAHVFCRSWSCRPTGSLCSFILICHLLKFDRKVLAERIDF
jgi:hypothetical protein